MSTIIANVWLTSAAAWIILMIVLPSARRSALKVFLKPASWLGAVVMVFCVFVPLFAAVLHFLFRPMIGETPLMVLSSLPLLVYVWWAMIFGLRYARSHMG